jgi:hypothetical protein
MAGSKGRGAASALQPWRKPEHVVNLEGIGKREGRGDWRRERGVAAGIGRVWRGV